MSESGPTNIVTNLSIEETNKIRLSLGLKPLKVETSKESKPQQQTQQSTNDETSYEVLDAINKLKKKRELNSKLKGKSIAEQLLEGEDDNDNEDDVSNWVSKSRSSEKEKQIEKKNNIKNLGKNKQQQQQQQRYNQNNLQGIKVGNDIKSFDDENEHILTLQDSSVLDDEYEDVLVNVNISEKEKREKLLQGSKKKSKFDKYDDFGEHKGGILDDYDNDNLDDDNGFILGSGGNVVDQSSTSQESLRDQTKKNLASLASYNMEQNTTNSILSSFYSQEEMDRFKKNRENKSNAVAAGGGKEKKKKKLRKKSTTDNILNELDATTSNDLGSRKNRNQTDKERKEIENQREREENYKKALDKANEDTSSSKVGYSKDYYEEAEDEDFYNSLSTAKKAPILSQKNIAELIVNKKKQQQQQQQNNIEEDYTNNLEEITINPTAEFARSLNPDGLISNYRSSSLKVETTTTVDGDEEMKDIQEDNKNDDDNDDEDDDDEDDDKKNKKSSSKNHQPILPDEPLVSGSVSAALRLFAQKGDLQPNPATNNKKRGINYDNDESTVVEHKDEFGRVMNRKEAFVKMSQIFHGKKSGKNKMEKRKRLYDEELKKMKMDSNDTPLGMVKSFQNFQEKTNSPFLVLSGGSQTNILKQNGGKQ